MKSKFQLLLEILYPSVLLYILTDILTITPSDVFALAPKVLIFWTAIMYLLYFFIDYIYLCISGYNVRNTSFFLDVIALVLNLFVAKAIIQAGDKPVLTIWPMIGLIIIHVFYLIWNFIEKETVFLKVLNFAIILTMGINLFWQSNILFLCSLIAMCIGLLIVVIRKAISRKLIVNKGSV